MIIDKLGQDRKQGLSDPFSQGRQSSLAGFLSSHDMNCANRSPRFARPAQIEACLQAGLDRTAAIPRDLGSSPRTGAEPDRFASVDSWPKRFTPAFLAAFSRFASSVANARPLRSRLSRWSSPSAPSPSRGWFRCRWKRNCSALWREAFALSPTSLHRLASNGTRPGEPTVHAAAS